MKPRTTARSFSLPRIKRAPAFLKPFAAAVNAIADFLEVNRVIPGPGVRVSETPQGVEITVDPDLLQLLQDYANGKIQEGNPYNIGSPANWQRWVQTGGGGTGGGTGLPDVETDPITGNPTYDGQPLGWQTRYVCVSDGAGGWTPMQEHYYGSDPFV